MGSVFAVPRIPSVPNNCLTQGIDRSPYISKDMMHVST
jgi:hypothetical protein